MDLVDQIESSIVRDSEDFFAAPNLREDLHVTIRITKDFYQFLCKNGDQPSSEEIAYMMDTIRSGLDAFFSLAYVCRVIETGTSGWKVDRNLRWNLPELRERFLSSFDELAASKDSGAVSKLAILFALTHLQLAFVASYFPFAILNGVDN